MNANFGILFSCLLLTLLHSGTSKLNKDVQFDYYVYAQQWPESVCLDATHSHTHNCSISSNTTAWTVHGLWPSQFKNATLPENCNASAHFDINALKDIRSDLDARWPNLYTDEAVNSFWKHEWDKHGTCALGTPEVNNEHDYFKKALDINLQLDIYNNLKKRNVPPLVGYTYLYTDFLQAAMDIVGGKTVHLQCFHERHQKGAFVLQLQVCLDKKFQPINCKNEHKSNCEDFPVFYPPIRHPY